MKGEMVRERWSSQPASTVSSACRRGMTTEVNRRLPGASPALRRDRPTPANGPGSRCRIGPRPARGLVRLSLSSHGEFRGPTRAVTSYVFASQKLPERLAVAVAERGQKGGPQPCPLVMLIVILVVILGAARPSPPSTGAPARSACA
jgi:hypothetical protein